MEKTGLKKKILEGVIVSTDMQKTVKVLVETPVRHPVYKKIISKRKVFFAHTTDEYAVGDTVKIKESRPYSKNVRWVVVNNKK